jgi:hypothetical protein
MWPDEKSKFKWVEMVTIAWKYSDSKRMPENPGFCKEDDTRTRLRCWCKSPQDTVNGK